MIFVSRHNDEIRGWWWWWWWWWWSNIILTDNFSAIIIRALVWKIPYTKQPVVYQKKSFSWKWSGVCDIVNYILQSDTRKTISKYSPAQYTYDAIARFTKKTYRHLLTKTVFHSSIYSSHNEGGRVSVNSCISTSFLNKLKWSRSLKKRDDHRLLSMYQISWKVVYQGFLSLL